MRTQVITIAQQEPREFNSLFEFFEQLNSPYKVTGITSSVYKVE